MDSESTISVNYLSQSMLRQVLQPSNNASSVIAELDLHFVQYVPDSCFERYAINVLRCYKSISRVTNQCRVSLEILITV
jgi:hypothetical protein